MINKLKQYMRQRRHYRMAVANTVKLPVRSQSGCWLFVDPAIPNTTVDRLRSVGGA